MEFSQVEEFMNSNHRGVINTIRPNGAIQSSIVVCGTFGDDVAFVSIRGSSAKIKNLRQNPRCTVVGVTVDWRSMVAVEGNAKLLDSGNTGGEELRLLLRDVYRACGGGEHPDWDEYDKVMLEQGAVVVRVTPERAYGFIR